MDTPNQEFTFTPEIFLAKVELATWAEVGDLIKLGIHLQFPPADLLDGLKSQRKQTIEIITGVLVQTEATVAAPALIELMLAQADSANAIRARNALIGLGVECAEAILPHLTAKSWQVRQYLVQCLGLYQVPLLIEVLEAIQANDKSGKVRETARQAILFTLGEAELADCSALPGPDEREFRIGVVSEGF